MVTAVAETSTRRLLVDKAAAATGEAWARGWLEELRSEGRAAAGGWPGTVSQARSRVRASLVGELARARQAGPTAPELEDAARAAYARARDVWLASARADDIDELSDEILP